MTNLIWERYPNLSGNQHGKSWLVLLGNLGRADATLDAYARGLSNYLRFCLSLGVNPESATLEHISLYVRHLGGDTQDGETFSPPLECYDAAISYCHSLVVRPFGLPGRSGVKSGPSRDLS